MRKSVLAAAAIFIIGHVSAHEPQIRTNRESSQVLPLPKQDDVFHFVIFGDRTGGPAEGIEILRDAVTDTNLLDPDLVMTVGDLVNGYNETPQWMEQTKEFRDSMNALKMPWFPVAGNHDVYWRGEGERPPQEHEANYETHFGPLWYWFKHKNTGFVVLYTDEGNPEKGLKDFGSPDQMQMSDEQHSWLRESLTEMNDSTQIFVFLHHPRWLDSYKESNWSETHSILVEAGNVKAVFAGHIHRLDYGGEKDGIEYFALATTGGSMPGHFPALGYVHHFNIVTVREDVYSIAVLPVGSVIDPRVFTPERNQEIQKLRTMTWQSPHGPILLDEEGAVNTEYHVDITNPAPHPIEVTLTSTSDTESGWRYSPDHRHAVIPPGETRRLPFRVAREAFGFDESFGLPELQWNIDYLEAGTRVSLPPRVVEIPTSLSASLSESLFDNGENSILNLNGSSSLKVNSASLPIPAETAFTVEAWVQLEEPQKEATVISKAQSSEFAIFIYDSIPQFDVHLNGSYVSAKATEALEPDHWTHIAGEYDGKEVRLYVNGKLVGSTVGQGVRTLNPLPLFVGADPNEAANPTRPLKGQLDEVRLSLGSRYEGADFEPQTQFSSDERTILLLHLDQSLGVFHLDQSGSGAHAIEDGEIELIEEARPTTGR